MEGRAGKRRHFDADSKPAFFCVRTFPALSSSAFLSLCDYDRHVCEGGVRAIHLTADTWGRKCVIPRPGG